LERGTGERKEGYKGREEWKNRDEKIVSTRIERKEGDMSDNKTDKYEG
jgi:hypothetical protein